MVFRSLQKEIGWFQRENPLLKMLMKKQGKVIRRGSIFTVNNLTNGGIGNDIESKFLVLSVHKESVNKWYQSKRGEDPDYPLKEAELPKFRLWIRKIHVKEDNEIVMLSYEDEIIDGNMREAEIVDGRNVRESYMVVPLSNVKRLLFEVEI